MPLPQLWNARGLGCVVSSLGCTVPHRTMLRCAVHTVLRLQIKREIKILQNLFGGPNVIKLLDVVRRRGERVQSHWRWALEGRGAANAGLIRRRGSAGGALRCALHMLGLVRAQQRWHYSTFTDRPLLLLLLPPLLQVRDPQSKTPSLVFEYVNNTDFKARRAALRAALR